MWFRWESGHIVKQEKTANIWLKRILSHFSAPRLVCLLGDSVRSMHVTHPDFWCSWATSFRGLHNSTHCPTAVILFTRAVLLKPPNIYAHPSGLVCVPPTSRGAPSQWVECSFVTELASEFGSGFLQLQALVKDGAVDHCHSLELCVFLF